MTTRRSLLKSTLALAGAWLIPAPESKSEPCLLALDEPFNFEDLKLPKDCIGLRLAMSVDAFHEMLAEIRSRDTSGYGAWNRDLYVEKNGTRWSLMDMGWGDCRFNTKDDAVEACRTGLSDKRVPFFSAQSGPGARAEVNPEWRAAEWTIVTILRFQPPVTPPEPFKFLDAYWINETPA